MTLTAGTFNARGVSAGLGFTSNGAPQVAVELKVLDEGFVGETITWFGYFTEGTHERTIESLRTLGWKGDDLDNLDGIADNDVRIVLDEEEYDGKTRLKVKWINKAGGLALKTPMTPEQARAFARQMKGAVLASSAKRPAQTQQARPAQTRPTAGPRAKAAEPDGQLPPEAYGDDIPF
jgi:hypothetical protein